MKRKPGSVKTAGVVIAATLLVVCVLVAAFLASTRSGTRDTITLPEAGTAPSPGSDQEVESEIFLEVDRENIRQVLDAMGRPEAYHQVLTVSKFWDSDSSRQTVEFWQSGERVRARIQDDSRTKHLLTDGQQLWVWYEGETAARQLALDGTITLDDLTGIPTYETLVALEPSEIAEAGFVTLDEMEGLNCLYLRSVDGEQADRYWVDANTQLLCRADSQADGALVYQLEQTACEVFTPGDATLESMFTLPDGTAVAAPSGE